MSPVIFSEQNEEIQISSQHSLLDRRVALAACAAADFCPSRNLPPGLFQASRTNRQKKEHLSRTGGTAKTTIKQFYLCLHIQTYKIVVPGRGNDSV